MNRYQDNLSPEPNVGINLNECYKTPNLQYTNILNVNQLYPTPPSDNDDNSILEANKSIKLENLVTPNIPNYYSINNDSQDGSLVYSQNNTSLEEQNQILKKPVNTEAISQQQNTNRFKRRSRTTYTKSQLDALEATFQKTHYPEIRVVDDLSSMLNLSTERISIWFQNRRARFKKARKLETHENRFTNENKPIQYNPTDYSNTHLYQNLPQMPNYNQFYLPEDKIKNFAKLPNTSSPMTPTNNYSLMNRNLLNNFSNTQTKPVIDQNSHQVMNSNFYNNNNLNLQTQFYSNQIPSNHGFYQPNLSYSNMGYPVYQNTNVQ